MSRIKLTLLLLCVFFALPLFAQQYDVLIRNGRVVDGSGNPWTYADVGVIGDRVAFVGHAGARRDGQAHHRCHWADRRAGFHRHAGAVGVQPAGGQAGGQQVDAGRDHRDHRRRRFDRADQRRAQCGARRRPAALPRHRRLALAGGVFPAADETGQRNQSRDLRRSGPDPPPGDWRERSRAYPRRIEGHGDRRGRRHERRRHGSVERADLRSRLVCQDRGVDRAGQGGRSQRRRVRFAHSQRGRQRNRRP